MTYRLTVRDGFAAAHRIVGSGGKCEMMHGHNFTVELAVEGNDLAGTGMLVDFAVLKRVLGEILRDLDHRDLNDHPAFAANSPSSENIARHVFRRACEALGGGKARVAEVTVFESERAWASCRE